MAKSHAVAVEIQGKDRISPIVQSINNRFRILQRNLTTAGTRINRTWQGTTQAMNQLGVATQEVAMGAAMVGGTMAAVGAGLMAVMGKALSTAMGFEHAMNGVKAVANATQAEFDQLTQKARELGASTQFTAEQAANGMKFLAMTGYDAGQILSAIGPMLDLAAASGMDLARTADIVSNIMQGFQLTADQASRAANTLAVVAANANTNIEQLGEAMKYAAPTAQAVGMSMETAAAAIGVMSDAGIQGSMAGTALRRALIRLSAPPKEAADALERLGVVVAKNVDGSVDLITTLERLKEAQMSAAEASKIFGMYGASAALAMSNATEKLRALQWKAISDITGLQKMVATMTSDLSSALIRVKSAFEALAESLGGPWLETLRDIADGFANMIRWVANFLQKYPLISEMIGGITSTLGGLLSILGLLTIAMAGIGFAVRTWSSAWAVLTAGKARGSAVLATTTTAINAETAAIVANTAAMNAATLAQARFQAGWAATSAAMASGSFTTGASTAVAQGGILVGLLSKIKTLGLGLLRIFGQLGRVLLSGFGGVVTLGVTIGTVAAKAFDWLHGATAITDDLERQTKGLTSEYGRLKKKFDDLAAAGKTFRPLDPGELMKLDKKNLAEYRKNLDDYEKMMRKQQKILINQSLEFKSGITDFLFGEWGYDKAAVATEKADAAKKSLQQLRTVFDQIRKAKKDLQQVELGETFNKEAKAAEDSAERMKKIAKQVADAFDRQFKKAADAIKKMTADAARSIEKLDTAWADSLRKVGATTEDKAAATKTYLDGLRKTVRETAEKINKQMDSLRGGFKKALDEGMDPKTANTFLEKIKDLGEQGSQAFEQFRQKTKSVLDKMKGDLQKVNQELADLTKSHTKRMQDIDDMGRKAIREIERRGMSEKEKETESKEFIVDTGAQVRTLIDKGDVQSLERARQLASEMVEESRKLKDPETAKAAITASLDALKQVETALTKVRKEALEQQKKHFESQIKEIQALSTEIDTLAKKMKAAVTIDTAQAQIAIDRLRQEVEKKPITVKVKADTSEAEREISKIQRGGAPGEPGAYEPPPRETLAPAPPPKEYEPSAEDIPAPELVNLPRTGLKNLLNSIKEGGSLFQTIPDINQIGSAVQDAMGRLFDPGRIQETMDRALSGITDSMAAMSVPSLATPEGLAFPDVKLSPEDMRILSEAAAIIREAAEMFNTATEKGFTFEDLKIDIRNRSDGRVNAGLGSSTRFR